MDRDVLKCAFAKGFLYNPLKGGKLLEGKEIEELYYDKDKNLPLREVFSVSALRWAESEVEWCREKGIQLLFKGEQGYPPLLMESDDAPIMLYYKGSADLGKRRSISIVGTRLASSYGKECCENIIQHIGEYNPLVVSGLAYGIDVAAHKAALEAGLESVAVLPNGMDTIYPVRHRGVAAQMLKCGGLLTEFPRGEPARKMNFIKRNRIIAAISQAVIIVESRIKGGSMSTVEYANFYNRDIFAVPGRFTDTNSFGCNYLIAKNVAAIYNTPSVIPISLGWVKEYTPDVEFQPKLFSFDIEKKEKILLSLEFDKAISLEQICAVTGVDWGEVSMLLLELELEGRVKGDKNGEYIKIR